LIDAEGARSLQFRWAVATGKQSRSETVVAARRNQIPNAVAPTTDRIAYRYSQSLRGYHENIWSWLCFGDVVAP
jgi:hypothetical protein